MRSTKRSYQQTAWNHNSMIISCMMPSKSTIANQHTNPTLRIDHSSAYCILYLQQPLVVFFWCFWTKRKVDDEAPAVFLPSPIKDSGYDNQKTQGADGRPHHFQHLGGRMSTVFSDDPAKLWNCNTLLEDWDLFLEHKFMTSLGSCSSKCSKEHLQII